MKVRNIVLISACLLLSGCQGKTTELDTKKILEEMLESASGEMQVLEDEQIKDILFIEDDTVCVGATSVNQIPSEILLCKGDDESVKSLLEDRKQAYEASASMYSADTLVLVNEAILEKTADTWMFILDENADKIAQIAQNYAK